MNCILGPLLVLILPQETDKLGYLLTVEPSKLSRVAVIQLSPFHKSVYRCQQQLEWVQTKSFETTERDVRNVTSKQKKNESRSEETSLRKHL